MTTVGSAEVVVRAITLKVRDDIAKAFRDANPAVAQAGREHARLYRDQFDKTISNSLGKSIETSLFKADVTSSGALGGSRYANSFNKSVDSNLKLEQAVNKVNLSNAGQRAGSQWGNAVTGEVRRAGRGIENEMGGSGGRAGSAFTRAFMSSGFQNAALAAREAFSSFLAISNLAGPALAGLVGGLSAAVGGLFAMAAAASQAIGVLGALPSALSVAAQAGATLKLAFSGVGAAFKAGIAPVAAQTGGATRAVNAGAKAVKAAERGIADASRQAARQVADAKRALKEAYVQAARAAADAARRVADAERDLADAQNETRLAQLALTNARKAGLESLQQLGFSAEDAALGEQRAALQLEDAYAAYQAVQDLPADNRTRVEAELAFKEAELNYRQAKDRASDLAAENEAAAQAGVDGTKEVVDAKKDINEAQKSEIEAEQKLKDARRDQGRVAEDNAKRIAAAQRALSQAQADGARAVANAQQALRDAHQQLGQAAEGAANKVDKFAEAMKNLSPQAQEFVRYLISIRDEVQKLKDAAGEELFPKLQTALEPIVSRLFPVLEDQLRATGSALGDVAIKISGAVTSAEGLKHIKNIMGDNTDVIKVGGAVLENLVKVLLRVMDAAGPLVKEFADWALTLTDGWDAATKGEDGMKRLTDFFDKAAAVAKQLGRIITNVMDVIGDLGDTSKFAGQGLLSAFERATKALSNFTSSDEGRKQLGAFFSNAEAALKTIGGLIGKVAAGFLKMGGSPEIGEAFKTLGDAGPNITKIFDTMTAAAPKVATLFVKVTDIIGALTASDSTGSFLDGMIAAADKLSNFLSGELVQAALKMAAPILGAALAMGQLWKLGFLFLKIVLGIPIGIFKIVGKIMTAVKAINSIRPSVRTAKAVEATGAQRAKPGGMASGATGKQARRAASVEGAAVGKSFADGMARGIKTNIKEVGISAKIMAEAAINAVKTRLKSKSPSLVAMGIGEDFGEGFERGIKASQAEVDLAAKKLSQGAVTSAKSGTAGAAAAGAGVGKAAVAPAAAVAKGASPAAQAGNMSKALGKAGGALKGFGKIAGVVGKGIGGAFSLAMGPIGMIAMIAIPLLIEAFKYLYNNSEGFRKFIDGIVAGLKMLWDWLVKVIPPALQAIGGFFKTVWGGIKTAFDAVAKAILWIWNNVLSPPIMLYIAYLKFLWSVVILVWNGIKAAIAIAIEGIRILWETVLKPVIDAIVAGFKWTVDQIMIFWNNFILGLQIIWAGIQALWTQYGQPAIDAVREAFKTVVGKIVGFFGLVIAGWKLIFDKLAAFWSKYGVPIVNAVKDFFKKRIDAIVKNFTTIKDGFTKIINAVRDWWKKYGEPIINTIKQFFSDRIDDISALWVKIKTTFVTAINSIKSWFADKGQKVLDGITTIFENFVEGVGDAWDTIKEAPKKGINALIKNVNKWLVKPLNKLTKPFGLEIKEIEELAEGGPITGRGGPKEDNQLRRLSVGEYVLREKAVRSIGPETANYINRTGRLPLTNMYAKGPAVGGGNDPKVTKESPLSWLKTIAKKGAGNLIAAAIDKVPMPKGDLWIEKLIRGLWKKFREKAKAWGDKRTDDAQRTVDAEAAKAAPSGGKSAKAVGDFYGSVKGAATHYGAGYSTHSDPHGDPSVDMDIRGSKKKGYALAGNMYKYHSKYSLAYIIWNMKIVSGKNGWKWRKYSPITDKGDWAHTGHVHITYLAKGGVVSPTPGGMLATIGEAGKPERVEPLDSQGLSVRDRAIIKMLAGNNAGGGGTGNMEVRVFIGNQELTDIVNVQIVKHDKELAQALNVGTKRRYQ